MEKLAVGDVVFVKRLAADLFGQLVAVTPEECKVMWLDGQGTVAVKHSAVVRLSGPPARKMLVVDKGWLEMQRGQRLPPVKILKRNAKQEAIDTLSKAFNSLDDNDRDKLCRIFNK